MDTFAALADPTRRKILEMLGERERAAGEIVEEFAATAPAISQHLKVLRESGLVRVRADAQRRIYSLDPQGLAEVDAWVRRLEQFWADRLDALEDELATETGKRSRRRKR